MSKQSDGVKAWRKRTKQRIIDAMGGQCCICGYSKCPWALVLHHIDPAKKAFPLSAIRASSINWAAIVAELRKCVLLCHNCHSEIHHGMIQLPTNPAQFNEHYADYKQKKLEVDKKEREAKLTPCPICKKLKHPGMVNCSVECATMARRRLDWDKIDLANLLWKLPTQQLAKQLGVSDKAIEKRSKKLGLTKPPRGYWAKKKVGKI
jgi:hypothetical protein